VIDEFATTEPYGDVKYADPGYRDNRKRYPIDTPDHIRAAWSYINQAKNAKLYNDEQLEAIRSKIKAAAKKAGIEISDEASSDEEMAARKKKRRRDMDDEYSMGQYPLEPPKAWFENPRLSGKAALTVTPEGRVYGHIAAWGECHRDFAGRECVLAPRSRKGYEPFHLGTVYTAEGDPVRVGKIVMDTRHADIGLGYTAAAVHYDHTGDEVAVVRAGEDDFGIWVAGAVVPEATPSKVAKLRRSPISGDWRRVEGNLELTAALAVNVPAFPVYAMDGEDQLALVAAGTIEPLAEDKTPPSGIMPTIQHIVEQVFASMEEKQAQEERAERLRDLREDEDIYAQREREARFNALTAAAQPPEPVAMTPPQGQPQAPAPTPAPEAGVAPEDGTVADGWPLPDDQMLQLQMNARFSILDEPAAGTEVEGAQPTTPEPAAGAQTVAQAPTPAQTPAPQG
jgi:hypothetical protein